DNSANRLTTTFDYLFRQVFVEPLNWEIIIVDNASVDNTSILANEILQKFPTLNFSYQIVTEPKQGLSFARHTGVYKAKYEYIVFCDDDNWLAPDYLQHAYQLISQNPEIGVLGGQSYSVTDIPLPGWFKSFEAGYAIGKQGEKSGYHTYNGVLWGAGMVTRKHLFLQSINAEHPSLLTDRKGTEVTSGGDSEYCYRVLLQNYKLYYNESLVLGHYLPSNRLTTEYRDQLFKSFEASSDCLYSYIEAIELKRNGKRRKLKLLAHAFKEVIIRIFWNKRLSHKSVKVFYYFLNFRYKADKKLQVIKHFYDR
ncbi:MAG: glycosyltransferase, partial [Sphingobacteriales bacterium]